MLTTLTEAQRIKRTSGLGASELASIAGISPFAGPAQVYERKVNPPDSYDEPTEDQERGVFFEPSMRAWYAHKTNSIVHECSTLDIPGTEIVMATPDGLVESPDGTKRGLEIKCPRYSWHWKHQDDEDSEDEADEADAHPYLVPEYYICQVQLEAAALGVDSVDVAAFLDGYIRIINVEADPDYAAALVQMGEAFWRNHVLKKEPPGPDASEHYAKWLAEKYPKFDPSKGMIDAPDGSHKWALQYSKGKAMAALAVELKREARNHLIWSIQDAEGMAGDWGKITYKNVERKSLDTKGLIEEVGEQVVKKYRGVTSHRRFDLRLKK